MSRTFSLPSRRALAMEYLIWSFGIAAFNGMRATLAVLQRDPEGIYDPEREIVHALLASFLAVFLVASMPLALMTLCRFIGARIYGGYWKPLDLSHEQAQREAPHGATKDTEGEDQGSGARALIEYVLVTILAAPFFSLIVIFVLGGLQFFVSFGALFVEFLLLFGATFFENALEIFKALGPEIGRVVAVASVSLFFWSVPVMIAACPAFCVAVRLLLKLSMAKALAGKRTRSGAQP